MASFGRPGSRGRSPTRSPRRAPSPCSPATPFPTASNATVAIASDFNPGTSPVLSMPEVVAMGCTLYGLDPLHALVAATANPAWVLGLDDRLGRLEPGLRADFAILEGPSFAQVP